MYKQLSLIGLYSKNNITNNNRIGENVKMNRKIIMMFTVTILLVLLLGVVNASEVSNDTAVISDTQDTSIQDTSIMDNTVKDTKTEQIESKEITKEYKNQKTASKTYDVSDFDSLHSALTSKTHDTVTVNITSNIRLAGDTTLNNAIRKLTINGNGKTINGKNHYQFLLIQVQNVTINNIKIINCNSSDKQGAIYNWLGNLTINNSTMNNNSMEGSGAAIYNFNGNVNINDSTFNYNKLTGVSGDGGAIYNDGNLTISNSILNGNEAVYGGGAISNFYGQLSITNCTLNNNLADYYGGAVSTCKSTNIINSTLNNNTAIYYDGGAVYNEYGHLNIKNSNLSKNNAENGGAIYLVNGTININSNTIKNNNATNAGGAIYNSASNVMINKNTFDFNTAEFGGAIYNEGINTTITNSTFTKNMAYISGAIDNEGNNLKVIKSTFNSNEATYVAAIRSLNCKKTNITDNIFKYNKADDSDSTKVIEFDSSNVTIKDNIGDTSPYNQTIYLYNMTGYVTNNSFSDKTETNTSISAVKGIIGEKLTLKAIVNTLNNKKVNEGNLIFKLNGVTIKDNGKLTGSSNPLKVKVTNGVATATITPDLDMRNANKLTAHYIGTNSYNASASSAVKIQISQRNATIVVSSNVKKIKQGQNLTITAKVYDTTNGKRSTNLIKYTDEFVYFKVNGITLKDSKGNMLKVKLVNGTATTKYTIPLGLSGVTDGKTMTPKNHTILAGFYNKNYQENIRNTSTFHVERSNITIRIENVTVNNKNHQLSVDASIKDYLGNYVSGPNKCIIKLNGVSLKNGTNPMYYYSTNGRLNIKNIAVPAQDKYTSLEIVTQDRLAYKSQRNTTTKFNIITQDTLITLNSIPKIDYNKNVTLTGKITGKAGEPLKNKTVTINFNGATKKISTDNSGNFKYTNKTNKLGSNTITVTFNGDSSYNPSTNKTAFQVIHMPTLIDFTVNDVNCTDYTSIRGTLADIDNNKLKQTRVILNINGETYYTRTDENGKFNYSYKTKKAGKNNITARFNGTENYNAVSKSKTFNVYKLETQGYLNVPVAVALGDTVRIYGEVYDKNEKPINNFNISIKINNIGYNVKTDKDGYFEYVFKATKLGKLPVEIAMAGNENYNSSSDSGYIEVLTPYNLTFDIYNVGYADKNISNDVFGSFCLFEADEDFDEGVYGFVENRYSPDRLPDNLLINATFYFKNSKGNVIARQFITGDGSFIYHELISGYTPSKTVVTYRKLTDDEKTLWNDGYRYIPELKEWLSEEDYFNYCNY